MKTVSQLFTTIALSATVMSFAITPVSAAQMYNQATVNWTMISTAKCYRIYYKESASATWQHSVRCKDLPYTTSQFTIKYLKPNTQYTYNVVTVGYDGKERWSTNKQLVTSPMQ